MEDIKTMGDLSSVVTAIADRVVDIGIKETSCISRTFTAEDFKDLISARDFGKYAKVICDELNTRYGIGDVFADGEKGSFEVFFLNSCADCVFCGDKYSFPLPNDKLDADPGNPLLKRYYCTCEDSEMYGKDITALGPHECIQFQMV